MDSGVLTSFWNGSLGGLMVALATVIGALPILFRSRKGLPVLHISLDFALGMMLAAAAFEMIAPAGQTAFHMGGWPAFIIFSAVGLGALFIYSVGNVIERSSESSRSLTKELAHNPGAWMFIVAMMLHNFPEGLASGAAWAGLTWKQSVPIIGAVALQNLPEGLMTALAFHTMGARVPIAFLGAFASAVVELVGGAAGGLLLGYVNDALPYLLAFAGGAMLFVSVREASERLKQAESVFKVNRDLVLGGIFMLLSARFFG